MKAITLYQPYASAIALGCKRIETRGYRTHHRGPIAIHAATFMRPEYMDVIRDMPEANAAVFVAAGYAVGGRPSLIKLPQACIVAIAEISDCVPVEEVAERYDRGADRGEAHWGDYRPGRFCWMLTNIRHLATPIPTRGFQGLWNWEPPADLVFAKPEAQASEPSGHKSQVSALGSSRAAGLLSACRLPPHVKRPPFSTVPASA